MTATDPNLWVLRPRPNPRATLRLICLPNAGGGPQEYHGWPASLPPDVEVCAVNLPGRGRRFGEPMYRRLGPLVDDLAVGLAPWLDRPFALFGHSMGALVAFELALAVQRRQHQEPVHLFVAGAAAPQFPNPRRFHQLPDSELIEAVRQLNGVDPEVLQSAELVGLLLPVLRADFEVVETYTCAQPGTLGCPLSVFGASADQIVPTAQLDPWRVHTTGRCDMTVFDGDHFFIRSKAADLLASIAKRLTAVR